MKRLLTFATMTLFVATIVFVYFKNKDAISGAPPYGVAESEVPAFDPYAWLRDWERPEGPAKVGLQVGHLNSSEFPDELEKLRNNTGASGGGWTEVEVNMQIAELVAEQLRAEGVEVDIIPATVPEEYWADLFVAIHADGNLDTRKSGFKIAAPWRDFTEDADNVVKLMEGIYQEATGMEIDPNVTRNMRGYYAFSWWRYDHAVHPMTTSVIVETGFLSSPGDRRIIVNTPEVPAEALSEAILQYLRSENVL